MDENFNNNTENNQNTSENNNVENFEKENTGSAEEMRIENEQNNNIDINSFSMDEKGNIKSERNGALAIQSSPRMFIILGWVSAALTAFVSPFFAIPGIIFGILANRQTAGKGNIIVVANIVLAAVNLIFGMFLMVAVRRMLYGY